MSITNYLANEGIRYVSMQLKSNEKIRDVLDSRDIEGSNEKSLTALEGFLVKRAKDFSLEIDPEKIFVHAGIYTSANDACDADSGPKDVGQPKDFVTVCLESELGVLFNSIRYKYKVFRVGKNEPAIAMATPPPNT
jgi:hypothetical protein